MQARHVLPSFVERTSYGYQESNPYSKLFEGRIVFLGTQIDDAAAVLLAGGAARRRGSGPSIGGAPHRPDSGAPTSSATSSSPPTRPWRTGLADNIIASRKLVR